MPENGSSPILEIAKATALASLIGIVVYAAWAKDWKFPDFKLPERAPRTVEVVPEGTDANDSLENAKPGRMKKTAGIPEPVQKFADSKYPGCDTPDLAMPDSSVWSSCEHGARIAYRAYSGRVCPNDGACKPESSTVSQGTAQSKAVMDALGEAVCEKGYRLPTKEEMSSAALSVVGNSGRSGNRILNGADETDHFARYFKIPRDAGANAKNVGYWTASRDDGKVDGYFVLTNSQALVFDSFPPQALRYRCVKDASTVGGASSEIDESARDYGNDGNTVVFWNLPDARTSPKHDYSNYAVSGDTAFPGCLGNDIAFAGWQVWAACDLWATRPYAYQPFSQCTGKWTATDCAKNARGKWLGTTVSEADAPSSCPKGYRLPTKKDFETLVTMAGGTVNGKEFANSQGYLDLFANVLKLSPGGYVDGSNGEYYGQGGQGHYWYADPSGERVAGFLFVTSLQAFDMPVTGDKSLRSVRCVLR